jgi:hypothetical protein
MKNIYHVEINFKLGPSYSTKVYATDIKSAQRKAKEEAVYDGMVEEVKRFTVRLLENEGPEKA